MTVKDIYPWGNFLIDDATGLPAIPEDHFWRVTRVAIGFWEVQLRERRKFWFSKKLESRIRSTETPIQQKWILDGAAHALSEYHKRDTRVAIGLYSETTRLRNWSCDDRNIS